VAIGYLIISTNPQIFSLIVVPHRLPFHFDHGFSSVHYSFSGFRDFEVRALLEGGGACIYTGQSHTPGWLEQQDNQYLELGFAPEDPRIIGSFSGYLVQGQEQ
jgi:hypothetical protein